MPTPVLSSMNGTTTPETPACAEQLTGADRARLGRVVEFTSRAGIRVTSSWMGQVRRVWAQLPDGELPMMRLMRDAMLAVYWPGAGAKPPGLTECVCFWADA